MHSYITSLLLVPGTLTRSKFPLMTLASDILGLTEWSEELEEDLGVNLKGRFVSSIRDWV